MSAINERRTYVLPPHHLPTKMLEYWMAGNESGLPNGSAAALEELLNDPGSAILFVGYPSWLLHFAAGCCILFMLVGIPGNLITVAALFRTKKMRNATAVFIMNLSISDLMFCCFNLPLAASTFWHGSWRHGALLCRLFPLLRYGLVAVSLFTVLAITINRYVMIGHPSLYPKLYRGKYLAPMVLATWIFGFGALLVTWTGLWGRFGLDPAIGSCSILPDVHGRSPKEFLFVIAFLTPCLAIVVCYARIFYIVRRTAVRSRANAKGGPGKETGENSQEGAATVLKVRESTRQEELSLSSVERSTSYEEGKARDTPELEKDPSTDQESKLNTSATIDDIPFADEREDDADERDTNLFLDDRDKPREASDEPLNARKRLERMASRASFIVESALRSQKVSGSNDMLETNLPKDMAGRGKLPRRESRFKSVRRARNPESAAARMTTKDRKLLKMILVIFSSFLTCYLPITLTKIFRDAIDWRGLNIAGYILIYLTTCINPVIYVVMSSEYRSAYKNVLLCRSDSFAAKARSMPKLTT